MREAIEKPACGRIVYVVGASGSGKDSLMRHARTRLQSNPRVLFAHRYITRAPDPVGENHIALSAEEFAARRAAGLFALDWESHGHAYGIGIEIRQWLEMGITVVVNGSREYLTEARRRFPQLLVARVEVSAEVLRERLLIRGREALPAIEARLERNRTLQGNALSAAHGIPIRNDGDLAEGGATLVDLILRTCGDSLCV